MATNFTVEKQYESANGEVQTSTETYKSTFQGGVLKVSQLDEQSNTYISVCTQPWHPKGDGSREDWENESQAVEWFKSTR